MCKEKPLGKAEQSERSEYEQNLDSKLKNFLAYFTQDIQQVKKGYIRNTKLLNECSC